MQKYQRNVFSCIKNRTVNWYVIYTKHRHEKKVEQDLISLGIQAYCPTRIKYRFWSDRVKKINVPVLPSMLLVRVEEKSLNSVFYSKGVTGYMFWLGKRAVVRDQEVKELKKSLSNYYLSKHDVGSKIGVSSFGNNIGTIEKKSKNKIWVSLENLGYKLKLETV